MGKQTHLVQPLVHGCEATLAKVTGDHVRLEAFLLDVMVQESRRRRRCRLRALRGGHSRHVIDTPRVVREGEYWLSTEECRVGQTVEEESVG